MLKTKQNLQDGLNCFSTTPLRSSLTSSQIVVFVSILVPLFLSIILSNLCVIVSLIKTKQRSNTSSYLIIILSLSDCLTGCISVPLTIVLYTEYQKQTNCELQIATHFFASLFSIVSAFMTVLLAIDRYINIDPHLKYLGSRIKTWFSYPKINRIVLFAVIGSLIISVTITIISFTVWLGLLFAIFCIGCYLLMLVPTLLYLHAYLKIKKYIRRSDLYNETESSLTQRKLKFFNKFGKTVLLLLVALTILYGPKMVFGAYMSFAFHYALSRLTETQLFVFHMTAVIADSNSTITALLIICRNAKIKQYLLNILRNNFSHNLDHRENASVSDSNRLDEYCLQNGTPLSALYMSLDTRSESHAGSENIQTNVST